MLRNLGNPSDLKTSLEREIAEAREAGLEGQDMLQALVVNFPNTPLKDVLAAWHATGTFDLGPPGPGEALRAMFGPEGMPPAALDRGGLKKIEITAKVALGLVLSQAYETHQDGLQNQPACGSRGAPVFCRTARPSRPLSAAHHRDRGPRSGHNGPEPGGGAWWRARHGSGVGRSRPHGGGGRTLGGFWRELKAGAASRRCSFGLPVAPTLQKSERDPPWLAGRAG
jgi:hypothetical protein